MYPGEDYAWGPGLWEQDCATQGPQYNMQGECIACFDEGDDTGGGGGGVIDDEFADCWGMYQAAGGTGSGIDYDTFEGLYC